MANDANDDASTATGSSAAVIGRGAIATWVESEMIIIMMRMNSRCI